MSIWGPLSGDPRVHLGIPDMNFGGPPNLENPWLCNLEFIISKYFGKKGTSKVHVGNPHMNLWGPLKGDV